MNYTSNPLANDELTEMIKTDRYARTLANIARRAENLWEDGYSAKLESQTAHFAHYTVTSPTGGRYSVCLSDTPKTTCSATTAPARAFPKYGTCKHLLGVSWQVRDAAQADAFDSMMANAEGPYGCDPFARW